MKYLCPALLTILIILILASWLIPNAVEWRSTQLNVCVEHEMAQMEHDQANSKPLEKALRNVLNEPCQEYLSAYIEAVSDTNPNHQKIMQDPEAISAVREKFIQIAVLYFSEFYKK